MPLVDSISPRRRSGERGFQLAAPIRWKVPLSPLVPRRERERGAPAMVLVSRCALCRTPRHFPLESSPKCSKPLSMLQSKFLLSTCVSYVAVGMVGLIAHKGWAADDYTENPGTEGKGD